MALCVCVCVLLYPKLDLGDLVTILEDALSFLQKASSEIAYSEAAEVFQLAAISEPKKCFGEEVKPNPVAH